MSAPDRGTNGRMATEAHTPPLPAPARPRKQESPRDPEPPAPRRGRPLLSRVLGRVRTPRARRLLGAALAGAGVLVVATPLILWGHYRLANVISRNAIVRGYITSVGSQLDGVVASVEVDAGQRVRAGQVLARFEDRQLQANVERARSQLEKASRELEVERMAIEQEARRLAGVVVQTSAQAAAARARVEAAQTQLDDAKVRFDHGKALAEAGAIAQDDLRATETTLRTTQALGATAEADRRAAEAAQHLAEVESDGLAVRRQHVVVLAADVEAARADLARAQADLKSASICAPADGWVVRRILEPGTSVVVGQPIVSLWIGPDVWVEAWIDERDLASVAVGSPVDVTVKPYPRRLFNGTVEMVGVSTDYELPDAVVPQPRTTRMRASPVVCVRVRLAHPDGLFPGLSAVVAIRKKAA